jgi:hypothetical protein
MNRGKDIPEELRARRRYSTAVPGVFADPAHVYYYRAWRW